MDSGNIRIHQDFEPAVGGLVVPDVEIMVFIQFASRLSKLPYRSTSSVIFKSLLQKLRMRTSYNQNEPVTKTLTPVLKQSLGNISIIITNVSLITNKYGMFIYQCPNSCIINTF